MVAYMHNQGGGNDGKHPNLLNMMWCVSTTRTPAAAAGVRAAAADVHANVLCARDSARCPLTTPLGPRWDWNADSGDTGEHLPLC